MKTYASPTKRIFSSLVAFVMAFSIVVFAPPFQEVVLANDFEITVAGPNGATVLEDPEWTISVRVIDVEFNQNSFNNTVAAWSSNNPTINASSIFHAFQSAENPMNPEGPVTNAGWRTFRELGLNAILTRRDLGPLANGRRDLYFEFTVRRIGPETLRAVNPTAIQMNIPSGTFYVTQVGVNFRTEQPQDLARLTIRPVIQLWSDNSSIAPALGRRLTGATDADRLTISGRVGSTELFGGTGNPADEGDPVFWIQLVGDSFRNGGLVNETLIESWMNLPSGISVSEVLFFRNVALTFPITSPQLERIFPGAAGSQGSFARVTLRNDSTLREPVLNRAIRVELPISDTIGAPYNFQPNLQNQVIFSGSTDIARLHIHDQVDIRTDGAIATITPANAQHFFWVLISPDGTDIVRHGSSATNRIDFSAPELNIAPGKYFLTGGVVSNGTTIWFNGEWQEIEVQRVGPAVDVVVDGARVTVTPANATRYYWTLIDRNGTTPLANGASVGNIFDLPIQGLTPGTYFLSVAVATNGSIEWLDRWEPVEVLPVNLPVVSVSFGPGELITISPSNSAPYYWALISQDGQELDTGSSQHNVINLANYTSHLPPGDYYLAVVATINGAHVWGSRWELITLRGTGPAMAFEMISDIEISVEEDADETEAEYEIVAEEYTAEEEVISEDYAA